MSQPSLMAEPVVGLRESSVTLHERKNSGVQRFDVASSAIALTPFSQYSLSERS